MIHIVPKKPLPASSIHRVVWCPFLPDEDDCDEDKSTLIAFTHGNKGLFLNTFKIV